MKTVLRKNLLYKSEVEYADYCINHAEGCSHGCRYPCYAMMIAKRFGKIKSYKDWCTPKIVGNALELLDKEIPRHKKNIKFVHLCFTTDPFMYQYPEVGKLSLKIIEKLHKNGIKSTVLTKGIYPKCLTDKQKYGNNNEYGITIVSLDNDYKKIYEPFCPAYEKRIKALKTLHNAGLKTWISMEPYPTPNIANQNLMKILKSVSFVDRIIFGKLNYNGRSKMFKNNDQFYENCARQVKKFCKKHGISYHIKFGTGLKKNKKTQMLFQK